jgi:type VI secretion system protein ImpA
MSILDSEKLLKEIAPDVPSGDNLEYDPGFVAMTQAAQGKAEQRMGDAVVPGEEPRWGVVKSKAIELLGRSKDLRVAVYLTQALLKVDGFQGMAEGLTLINSLMERFWDTVHPQLDPDDDNDPTFRVNTLAVLFDADTTLRNVRETPLVSSRALGRFSLRDVEIAGGKAPPPAQAGQPPAEMSVIEAAFAECELEVLQATADGVSLSIEQVGAIESTLTERVGAAQSASFSALAKALKGVQDVLNQQLARRGVAVAATGGVAAGSTAPAAAAPISGAVNSRQDAILVLDKVCDYFRRNEPSSPVPLLLERAKALVSKSFVEIIRDLAPDGIAQVDTIRGARAEE